MIFSSDELQILEYLKSWTGTAVPMAEISRCASGRQRFRESPNWARGLMGRIVEAGLVEVNDRGHFKMVVKAAAAVVVVEEKKAEVGSPVAEVEVGAQVDDNYFPQDLVAGSPSAEPKGIVGEDYFPEAVKAARWISPQMKEILRQAGLDLGGKAEEGVG